MRTIANSTLFMLQGDTVSVSSCNIPNFLVGDSASARPLMTWLMKPFAHNTIDKLTENLQL